MPLPSSRLDRDRLDEVDAATAARWIAVLPLAATEQHGPHLPLETDVMIGRLIWRGCASFCPTPSPRRFFRSRRSAFRPSTSISRERRRCRRKPRSRSGWPRRERGARRREEDRHRHQPWRQRRRDDAWSHRICAPITACLRSPPHGRASACRDGLFPAEELRHGIHGGAVETSIMLAATASMCASTRSRTFLRQHRNRKTISLAVDATSRPVRMAGAGPSSERRVGNATLASAEKGEALLEHGARGFIELLETSINSM